MTNVFCIHSNICRDRNTCTSSRLYQNTEGLKKNKVTGTGNDPSKSPTETRRSLFSQKTVKLTRGAFPPHSRLTAAPHQRRQRALEQLDQGAELRRHSVSASFSPVKNDDYKSSLPGIRSFSGIRWVQAGPGLQSVLAMLLVGWMVWRQRRPVDPGMVEGTVVLVPAAALHHEVTTQRPFRHVCQERTQMFQTGSSQV